MGGTEGQLAQVSPCLVPTFMVNTQHQVKHRPAGKPSYGNRHCRSKHFNYGSQTGRGLDYIMNIIAKPTAGSKQPARADRQRHMRPSPGKPRHIPRPAWAAASLPQGSERSDRLEVDRGILSPQPPRARVGDKK